MGSAFTSKAEFEAKFGAYFDEFVKLPVVQKNAITVKMFIQNDVLNDVVVALGLLVPQPVIVGLVKFKNMDDLQEVLRDPAYLSLFSAAEEHGHLANESSFFSANVVTKVDVDYTGDRNYVFGIHKAPSGLSVDSFERKVEAFLDNGLALPVLQNSDVLKHAAMWRQTLQPTNELQRLGLPAPQPWVVTMGEFDTYDKFLKIVSDDTMAPYTQILAAKEFPLSLFFHRGGDYKVEQGSVLACGTETGD